MGGGGAGKGTNLSVLPADLLLLVLQQEPAVATIARVACVSRSLLELTADASMWSSLLRNRHRALLGDDDPHMTLLPSAARPDACRRRPRSTGQWIELYHACEEEWIAAQTVVPRGRMRWLLWRLAFEAPPTESARQLSFALVVLRLAFGTWALRLWHCMLATLCAAGLSATVIGSCRMGLDGLQLCDRVIAASGIE